MDPFAPPPTIGIDLGRRAIKVAAVRGGSRPRLVGAAMYPTPDGAVDGGTIRNAAALTSALRGALRAAGIGRGRAVVGMGGRAALVRTLTLPPMPADELKNAVKYEAERHLPLRIDEAVLDAQVVREVSEDGQRRMEVLMAAVPERDALLFYHVTHDAGLDVTALEVSSLALARTLTHTETPTAAVDIGADATDIVIADRTMPPVCRSLPVGSDHLVSSTAAAGPEHEAAAGPGWHDLLEGLTRSIDYFQAQARREKVERVVVTGDGAEVPGVIQMLATELGLPITLGDPLAGLTATPAATEQTRDHGPAFAVAIGLARRTLS